MRGDAGWGYFDYRMEGEGFHEGFQSVPANWSRPKLRAALDGRGL